MEDTYGQQLNLDKSKSTPFFDENKRKSTNDILSIGVDPRPQSSTGMDFKKSYDVFPKRDNSMVGSKQ